MRILVVEDEKLLNEMITKTLAKEGYSVDNCFDGEDALHYLKMGEFDAVVMDIMMPKINGLEVVKRMRAANDATPGYISYSARQHRGQGFGTRRRSGGLSCKTVRLCRTARKNKSNDKKAHRERNQ